MYEIFINTEISSAHRLRDHPGPCRRLHGHNWLIEVRARCEELNQAGLGIDFGDLKAAVEEVCRDIDHVELNGLPFFKKNNPTAENLARYLFCRISEKIDRPGVKIDSVGVTETPGCGVVYREDDRC